MWNGACGCDRDSLCGYGLNDFLEGLGNTTRQIFLKRYFFMRDVKDIAKEMGITVSSVKVSLHRTRRELRDFLEKRGIVI